MQSKKDKEIDDLSISEKSSNLMPSDATFIIDWNDQAMLKIVVTMRPNLLDVLQYLSDNYEVGVFTAGEQRYADTILNWIDPHGVYFSFRLYRQHCI